MGGRCLKGRRKTRAAGLFVAAAVGVSGLTASHALAQTATWNGGATDANWSDANNWNETSLVSGDSLVFDGSSNLNPNDDEAAGFLIDGITFNSTAGAFALGGNAIDLDGAITDNSASNTQIIDQNLAIQASENVTVVSGGDLQIAGAISGNYGLSLNGAGIVQLTQANSFNGPVSLESGVLVVSNAGGMGTGSLSLSGGTLDLQNSLTTGESYRNNTMVTGATTIDVDCAARGDTTSSSLGTLSIGTQGLTVGAGPGIAAGTAYGLTFGATTLTGNASFTINDNGSGTGTLILGALNDGGVGRIVNLGGSGVVTLATAASSVTSGTIFDVGSSITLNVAAVTALGSGSGTIQNGGTLNIDNVTVANAISLNSGGILQGTGTSAEHAVVTLSNTASGTYTLQTSANPSDVFTLGNASNQLTGGVSGSTINVNGAGTVVLGTASTANNYAGIWNLDSGALSISADSNLGAAPVSPVANYLTFSGGTLDDQNSNSNVTLNSNRGIQIGSAGATINMDTTAAVSGNDLVIPGLIANVPGQNGALTVTGQGSLTLTNSGNSYSGGTIVDTQTYGTLFVQSPGALGTGPITLESGFLDLQTNTSINPYNITVTGANVYLYADRLTEGTTSTQNLGALTIGADTLRVDFGVNDREGSANVTFTSTTLTANGADFFNESPYITLNLGPLSGNYTFIADGVGQTTLSQPANANRTSAGVTVVAGLVLQNASAIGGSGVPIIMDGGNLDLQTGGMINPYDVSIPDFGAIASDLATPGTGINYTLGTLSMGTGGYLNGQPTGPTLDVVNGANVTSGTANLTFGATTLIANATTFEVQNGTNLTLGALVGNFSFSKTFGGTLTLDTPADPSRTSAEVTIASGGGTLELGSGSALGTSGVPLQLNGGTLDLAIGAAVNPYNTTVGGTATIASDLNIPGAGMTYTLGTLSIGAYTLNLTAGANVSSGTAGITFGTTTLTANGAAFDQAANTVSTLGALSGNFSFTVQDSGKLILNSASTRTAGAVTLSAGTLSLGNTSALGTSAVPLSLNGGTLDLATSSSINAYNTTVGGATATIDSDRATPGAGITQTLGTLSIGADSLDLIAGANDTSGVAGLVFGTTTLSANGAVFDEATGTNLTLGALGGNFSFTKQDGGSLTLGAAANSNRTSARVTLAGGSLILQNAGALGASTVPVTLNSGTLDIQTSGPLNPYNVTVGGNSVSILNQSSATQTLGTLSVGSDQLNVSGGAVTFGAVAITGNPTFDSSASTNLTLGALGDGGVARAITFQDTGNIYLAAAASSLTQGTTVNVGASDSLTLEASGALGNNTASVVNSGSLNINSNESLASLTSPVGSTKSQVNVSFVTLTIDNSASNGLIANLGGPSGSLVMNGSGAVTITGTDNYLGSITINSGAIYFDGTGSALTNLSIPSTITSSATLGGLGTIGLQFGKTATLTGSSASAQAILAPGDTTTSIGTLTVGTSGNSNSVIFGANSELALTVGSGTAANGKLAVVGTLNTSNTADSLALNLGTLNQGKYVLATYSTLNDGTNSAANGGFGSVTGLTNAYHLEINPGEIDLVQKEAIGTILANSLYASVFAGASDPITFTVANSAYSGGDSLNFTTTSGSHISGSASGSVAANSTSSAISGLSFTAATAGNNQSGSFTINDPNSINSGQTGSVTVNVVDHAQVANVIVTPQVTQGQSVNFTYALSNPTNGSALRDGALVTAVSANSSGYTSGYAGATPIASGASSSNFTGSFTSTYGAPTSQIFNFTYGDQDNYLGANNNNQTATLTVTPQVNALVEVVGSNSNALIDGRPLIQGASTGSDNSTIYVTDNNGVYTPGQLTNLNNGQGINEGYVNIAVDNQNGQTTDYLPSDMWVYFTFSSGSNLTALESNLTAFHYAWQNVGGPSANELAIDLPVSLGSDPVLDFDFSNYTGVEVTGLAAVPEPGSLSLLAISSACLIARRRRKS
jgi:fibronectin-binding autotransporter adhesin